jgi:hypothetical protein
VLQRLAAVSDHRVSGDERGCIRAQPDDGRGDLVGSAHPSDRFLGDDPVPFFGVPPVKRSIISVSMIPGQMALIRMFEAA